jgi:hypothetical protein
MPCTFNIMQHMLQTQLCKATALKASAAEMNQKTIHT